jgi:ABC-2 type transport system ATP-binding protein
MRGLFLLELRRVSKHFSSIPAVDDVSFSARPGEVTGYLGPNGSGKSTTMKMITGLIEMTLGHILFQGKPIQDDLIAYKRRMGYVPEEPYLYNHLSGLEYLTMVAQLRGLPARQSSERIDGMLRLLSLHSSSRGASSCSSPPSCSSPRSVSSSACTSCNRQSNRWRQSRLLKTSGCWPGRRPSGSLRSSIN